MRIGPLNSGFAWPIWGLHKTSDGYVRLHHSFQSHRDGAKELLGCLQEATREDGSAIIALWRSVDLESASFDSNSKVERSGNVPCDRCTVGWKDPRRFLGELAVGDKPQSF
ncbi:hypothetical protein PEBR_30937 [Penicillium brasilianum]|uniref:Uncharacterized protein n=1 Tax=Penicillium brasilianum TaxID=104259 RepID=A0A1S9RI83_PENBI|nr:hypothetical protein PEBR_30937 [Penicillium brasilianum]